MSDAADTAPRYVPPMVRYRIYDRTDSLHEVRWLMGRRWVLVYGPTRLSVCREWLEGVMREHTI